MTGATNATARAAAAEITRALGGLHEPMGRKKRAHLDAILEYMRQPGLEPMLERWLDGRLSRERLLSATVTELGQTRRLLQDQFGRLGVTPA